MLLMPRRLSESDEVGAHRAAARRAGWRSWEHDLRARQLVGGTAGGHAQRGGLAPRAPTASAAGVASSSSRRSTSYSISAAIFVASPRLQADLMAAEQIGTCNGAHFAIILSHF